MYPKIIQFWFEDIEPKLWWVKSTEFDQRIINQFTEVLIAAEKGELFEWRAHPQGRLAEIIVLDQFSRNIYRDSPKAFMNDGMALCLAQEAIRIEADQALPSIQRNFLYMPFMHSESKWIHQQAVGLFESIGNESTLSFELKHKAIIDQYGRYPHRNLILNRLSTKEEIAFLKQPGSSF